MDPTVIWSALTGAIGILSGTILKMWADRDAERKENIKELKVENADFRKQLEEFGRSSALTAQTMVKHADTMEGIAQMLREIAPYVKGYDGRGRRD